MGNGGAAMGGAVGRELERRMRSARWYALLIVYAVVLLLGTLLAFALSAAAAALSNGRAGAGTYGIVAIVALLFALAVMPAVSSRTLRRPGLADAPPAARIVAALAVEAVTALVLVVIAVPFLVVAAVASQLPAGAVAASVLVLWAQIWLLAAFGVALGGLIARPAAATASAYALAAVLTVGTTVVFAVVGNVVRHDVETLSRGQSWSAYELVPDCDAAYADGATDCVEEDDGVTVCEAWNTDTSSRGRFDLVWWMLAPNPVVVLAEGTPFVADSPDDVLQLITVGVRQAQIAGEPQEVLDSCGIDGQDRVSSVSRLLERTTPAWGWGLIVQALLAAGLLLGAHARLRREADRQRAAGSAGAQGPHRLNG